MPTDLISADNPYATMSLTALLAHHDALLARWQREDAERAARFAAMFGTTETK